MPPTEAELLATKPDLFIPIDNERIDELRAIPGLAIGEMAGRDAVAAILSALEEDAVQAVLPVAVYTGTEYGDWQGFRRNAEFVRDVAWDRFRKPVFEMAWLGLPTLWAALNGRYISEIERRYGRYSPCLGCHFYLHAARIPLAVRLGARTVISGDRESHDGRAKINQFGSVLDLYAQLLTEFGLDLVTPLRHLRDTAAVDAILGDEWIGGSPQPSCAFSSNFRGADGEQLWTEDEAARFAREIILPTLSTIHRGLVAGQAVDYQSIVRDALIGASD